MATRDESVSARFSPRVPLPLLEDPDIKVSEFAVLVALFSYADAQGKCWPSLSSIARRSHLNRSTVTRVLLSLEQDGYLTRSKRFEEGSKEPTSTLYTLIESRLGSGIARLGRGIAPLPEVDAQCDQVGVQCGQGRGVARPELSIEQKEENSAQIAGSKTWKKEKEESLFPATPYSIQSIPSSTHTTLPPSSKPVPRARKNSSVPSELLPAYHKVHKQLKETTEGRGITWQYGREGRALAELVKAYAKRSEELGPLVDFWIYLTASGDSFYRSQPSTASALLSLLPRVETELKRRKPNTPEAVLGFCPVCNAQPPQGAVYCPSCKTLVEDFGNPEAVTEAKRRREATG